jgi:hypothetical protein
LEPGFLRLKEHFIFKIKDKSFISPRKAEVRWHPEVGEDPGKGACATAPEG